MADSPGLKAALLDFDATLVDLPVDWDALRTNVAAVFTPYGFTPTMRPLLAGIRQAFADLESRGESPGVRAAVRRKVNRLLTEAELAAAPKTRPMPGARQFVQTLRDRRLKIIIQTSNSVRAVEQVLDRLAFPPVDAIAGRESARRPKPHPQGVLRELRRLGLRGDQCVLIGDGDFDVELGRTLGATTIRLGQGRLQADYTVASLKQAGRIIDQLQRNTA